MSIITALLVDDNSVFLDCASRFLQADERIEIVGHAASGIEAMQQVERLRPDVVVMDVAMQGMSGLDTARRLKAGPNSPLIVISTMHDHAEMREAATHAKADGFVAKSQFCRELLPLIKSLFDQRKLGLSS